MNYLKLLLGGIPLAFTCLCVATTTAQALGLVVLSVSGALTSEKMLRYAAVVYGIDLSELPAQEDGAEGGQPHELRTREEMIAERVAESTLLNNRQAAVAEGIDTIRLLFETLRSDNDRFEQMKSRFDAHLAQLENDARGAAIQEVERTLAILNPKQAKNLILRMLDDQELDPQDDVLQDIVTIIKAMAPDKRKKILGEFKTNEERDELHQILMEIGQLVSR